MSDRSAKLQTKASELRITDISHNELGSANGFHAAQANKEKLLDGIDSLLDRMSEYSEDIDDLLLDQGYELIETIIQKFVNLSQAIENLSNEGVHTPNFPKQRSNQIQQVEKQVTTFKQQTQPLDSALRLASLERKIGTSDALAKQIEMQRQYTEKLKKAAGRAERLTNNLGDKAVEKGVSEAESTFGGLEEKFRIREICWFVAFVISSIALVALVWNIVDAPPIDDEIEIVIQVLFKRLLLLSLAAVAMRITIGKYNLERNLRIIYDHRSTALQQYGIFENSIDPENRDGKNQLRLEVARYIFSDPETGYRGDAGSSGVTVNPILSTVERVAGKD